MGALPPHMRGRRKPAPYNDPAEVFPATAQLFNSMMNLAEKTGCAPKLEEIPVVTARRLSLNASDLNDIALCDIVEGKINHAFDVEENRKVSAPGSVQSTPKANKHMK